MGRGSQGKSFGFFTHNPYSGRGLGLASRVTGSCLKMIGGLDTFLIPHSSMWNMVVS